MQENTFFLIIVTISSVLLVLLIVVVVTSYKLLKLQRSKDLVKNLKNTTKKIDKNKCVLHEKLDAKGVCNICNHNFCELCICEHENLNFCKEHFNLFLKNNWEEFFNIKSSPDNPQEGVYLFNFKKKIWIDEQIPTVVITHYRINLEGENIESYICLMCRREDKETLFQKLKGQNNLPLKILNSLESLSSNYQ